MNRTARIVLGSLLIVLGFIFWGQGLGAIEGSAMTGSTFWAYAGPVIAGFGVALLVVTFQKRE
ncbi:hypothetical protein [Nocardioides jensenii]|uniref:hypothetical protein n=1 Tax=Nocardioides jensenii TaxID=1843 RepID=UPI000832E041|nr:hypothetical protein [Nocardioides jensenii]